MLRADGFEVSLVNSNPATIMTDPAFADRTYIEPLTPASVLQILEREKPDALLPTLGGQTGLNVSVALAEAGELDRLGVRMLGASLDAIRTAEDRSGFKQAMLAAGLDVPKAGIARTLDQALALEHAPHAFDVERLEVRAVGEAGVGHDRRGVRVDDDRSEAVLAQDLQRLRAGVVELARLPDDDRAAADQTDRMEVVPPRQP